VIGLLRASYTHLIFDLSKRFAPTDWTAMRMADVILIVAQLDLTSLRNVVRMVHTLGTEESLLQKVRVVINRVGSDDCDITLKKAEETIGQPIFWQIPNDYRAMLGARNEGVPLLQHAPKTKIQASLAELANVLCGKTKPAVAKKEKKSLFSFR
jgi:pilus assembly protein CpaE